MKTHHPTIVLTGGGSGGHVTPLLAVAKELKSRDSRLVYIGAKNDRAVRDKLENSKPLSRAELARAAGLDEYYEISHGKYRRFSGMSWWHPMRIKLMALNAVDLAKLLYGYLEARRILKKIKPDVVFSKGSYVAVPVVLAAKSLNLPIVTHDSDAVPGLAHRLLKTTPKLKLYGVRPRLGEGILVGVPISDKFLKKPTNQELLKVKQMLGLKGQSMVLFVGGGNGSDNINQAAIAVAENLADVLVVVMAGSSRLEAVNRQIEEKNLKNIRAFGFSPDVPALMNICEVLVTRAGATTLAEAAAVGCATVLIPNNRLTGSHQVENAKQLQDKKAALTVEEKTGGRLDNSAVIDAVDKLLSDKKLSAKLSNNIKGMAVMNASQSIAKHILSVVEDVQKTI